MSTSPVPLPSPFGLLRRPGLQQFVIALMIANLIGCGPVYRGPKKFDLFRVQPAKQPVPDAPIVPPKGLPLPDVPPVTVGPDAINPNVDPTAAPQERPIALDEAIQIALSNSGVVRVLSGGSVSAVAATPYDPHIADARLRAAIAAFDPVLTSSVYSNWINQPPDSVFGPGLAEPTQRDEANFAAAVSKPWLTGGETKIAYNPSLGYLYIPNASSTDLNPLYTSNLEFAVKQPFLKGAGIAVNKAPIRITQLRRDQTALEVKQAVMASVRSVTEAYWELFAARNAAQVLSEVVPLLQRVAQIEHERMQAQRSVRADVAKAHSELHGVRQQLVELRAAVVQRELRLRNLLGLPPSDGYMLVPASTPLQAPIVLDAAASIAMAQDNRPDLQRQQLAVRTRENELVVAKNAGLPQLDATALYRWNGVGDALDDSMQQMFGTKYQDWQTAMTMTVPLGRRLGAAGIRAATLQLARERAMMQQALHAAAHQISSLIQEAAYTHELFREADARWQANTVWLEGSRIRYENPPPAGESTDWLLAATNDYLSALRSQADAAKDAQSYLSQYNGLLARINEARGTILFDSNLDLVGEERAAAAASQAGPSGLPKMLPLPEAQPVGDLPPVTSPLMPQGEVPPLPPIESTPAIPPADSVIPPPTGLPLPTAPPSSDGATSWQPTPQPGTAVLGAPRPSALYPPTAKSFGLATVPVARPVAEPSLISAASPAVATAKQINVISQQGVRATGVQAVAPKVEQSLIARDDEPKQSAVASVGATEGGRIGVRATSVESASKIRFPGEAAGPAVETARRPAPPVPINLFQEAPIRR